MKITIAYVAVCVAMFGHTLPQWRALTAADFATAPFWLWLVPSAFAHSGLWHLATNMVAFAPLCARFERRAGSWRAALFLLAASALPSAAQLLIGGHGDIGASGVVFALAGYFAIDGDRRVRAIVIALLVWFVWCFVANARFGATYGNAAHSCGLIFGALCAASRQFKMDSNMSLRTSVVALLLLCSLRVSAAESKPSTAYEWMDVALEATAREVERHGARPTINSRELAIAVTAMYDAWSAYDAKAAGTRLGTTLRRPAAERTDANKTTAIAYAVYRALLDVYPVDREWLRQQMTQRGYDPDNDSKDVTTPQGIGNVAAAALCEYRHHDGANQFGDEIGSSGKPYSDYTYYAPVNTTEKLVDPNRWQPIPFDDGKGGTFAPGFLTPHWYRVKPFALERADQFRPPAPPRVDSAELRQQVDEVMKFNATLTPQQKATVEFMRDGPRSTGQSGHWLRFAELVSRRDHNDIDRDVKLFFTVGNVAFDAFIACWDAKRFYDTSRPWTLVRVYHKGEQVEGWAGPGKGVVTMPAEQWRPFSPATFLTPPFPGYVSGHSTVSGACAKVLELFTGSDNFGETEKRTAGSLTEAGFDCAAIMTHGGKPPADLPRCDVELPMPTFSAAAEMAGLSRVMGGYHVQADNVEGLKLGRKVAQFDWPKIQSYFDGTAGK